MKDKAVPKFTVLTEAVSKESGSLSNGNMNLKLSPTLIVMSFRAFVNTGGPILVIAMQLRFVLIDIGTIMLLLTPLGNKAVMLTK